MEELIRVIAQGLVDHPNQVSVVKREGERADVYQLSVAPEDMGKVIGKQGRVAKAIRTVVSAAAAKDEKRVVVEIV